ncbi:GspH/FimT family pseudopilin [Methylomagnum sp.]
MKIRLVQQGFTLIELAATGAVIAITLMLGVPSFKDVIQNNKMTSVINEFVTDFNIARSEAIKRARPVALCKRNTAGTACSNNNSDTVWLRGWLVVVDVNGNNVFSQADGDEIIRTHSALTSSLASLSSGRNRYTYSADGFAVGFTDSFVFCDSRGTSKLRARILNNTGRLREALDSNHNGIPENDGGGDYSCP